MERPVAGLERRPLGVSQLPKGVAKRLTGQLEVEPRQRLPAASRPARLRCSRLSEACEPSSE